MDDYEKIDPDRHTHDHEWIHERIEAERARKKMFEAATKTFMQWSITAICSAAAYYIQQHFVHG